MKKKKIAFRLVADGQEPVTVNIGEIKPCVIDGKNGPPKIPYQIYVKGQPLRDEKGNIMTFIDLD